MDNKITLRRAGLMLAYPLAYLYLLLIWRSQMPSYAWIFPTIFSVLFIGWNEIVLHGRRDKTDRRSFFWYAVMVLTSLTSTITPSFGLSMFAIHLCAIYSVLISNNILVEGKTGSYIWLDIIRGSFVKSFSNAGAVISDGKDLLGKKEGEEKKKFSFSWLIPVLILFPFFIVAMSLLSNINADFGRLVKNILRALDIFRYLDAVVIARCVIRAFFACPVCLFLYGLVSGCAGSDGEAERKAGEKCREAVSKRRNVSSVATGSITGLFSSMYLLFFVAEFRYIFGGLMGVLPEGFNVVDYARRGFFELVGVMAINMLVYVTVNVFERRSEGKGKVSKILMVVLMVESILFAIVSLSKLLMYFNTFGYTPKRMLAMWGTVILAAAAAVVIISVIKKRNHVRAWIIFTTASYVLMSIISGILVAVDYHGAAGLSARDEFIIYIENDGPRDISSLTVTVDDQMIFSECNADGSYLIPTNGGRECVVIKASDLPDGSNLKDSEIRIDFYAEYEGMGEEQLCDHYTFVEPREEDELSADLTLTGGPVRIGGR